MTVLRPSLPPVISSTTRMLSLPGAAACAVRATNCGTAEPRATRDEARSVWVRNCRRVNMMVPRGFTVRTQGSCQLVFRHRQDGVDGLAGAAVQGGPGGVALGDEGDELRPRLGLDAAGHV